MHYNEDIDEPSDRDLWLYALPLDKECATEESKKNQNTKEYTFISFTKAGSGERNSSFLVNLDPNANFSIDLHQMP